MNLQRNLDAFNEFSNSFRDNNLVLLKPEEFEIRSQKLRCSR